MKYQDFLKKKKITVIPSGFNVSHEDLNHKLFDFQKDMVKWAVKKGKAALFTGCGTRKSAMQLKWARLVHEHTEGNVLILAPLAVSFQTVREGKKFGINVNICRTQRDVKEGINITNYEMLKHFDANSFAGVILDESSILKDFASKTRNAIIDTFRETPYKLACTATPAPNDYMELGNHSEFLGVMTRTEMLSMFFTHDGGNTSKWRLKKHAVKDFWEWVASWAVMMEQPSDLGYHNNGFVLPPLNVHQITVKTLQNSTSLFTTEAQTLLERQRARKETINDRVAKCAELINGSNEPWIIWCNLNEESEKLVRAIDGAVEIRGSHSPEYKEQKMLEFTEGRILRLVSKPSIAGHGMNWQHCSNIAFVGLSDSFEEYYQAIRRCWRFGQTKPVNVYIITSEAEGTVVANVQRKEREFKEMLKGMIAATSEISKANIRNTARLEDSYNPQVTMVLPEWLRKEVG